MTSNIIISQPGAIHLLADTAGFDADGVVRSLHSKVVELPGLGGAVAVRGLHNARFADGMAACSSFDEVVARLPTFLGQMGQGPRVPGLRPDQITSDLIVAGWSNYLQGVICLGISNAAPGIEGVAQWAGYKPGEIVEAPVVYWSPGVDPGAALGRPIRDAADVHAMDPAVDGLALMQAQRLETTPYASGRHPSVGGQCELVSVTRSGVTTKILHVWPDQVGSHITP